MADNLHFASMRSPLGIINLTADDVSLLSVSFSDEPATQRNAASPILQKVIEQLAEYFEGKRFIFNLNLNPHGTDFQKKVWDQLILVPFGETRTYREIARKLGGSTYERAVGNANGKNPVAIIIPCHRIIGTGGKLTGYAGGIWRKQWLLNHEAIHNPHKRTLF